MSQPKTSRRDFLRGKAVVEQLQHAAGGVFSLAEPEAAGYLLRIGRRAMACEFEVLLNAGQYSNGADTAVAALDLVDELEQQLSVYREDSEISRLNQTAHQHLVPVEARLFALLETAAKINRETDDAYDIATGPLSKAWGFYRRAGKMPETKQLAEVMQRVGLRHVQFNSERCTIRFDTAGVELNLGSIGKGYALDRAAELLLAAGIENFLLHGGNSSVLGRGVMGISMQRKHSTVSPGLCPGVEAATDHPCEENPRAEPGAKNADCRPGWTIGLRHPLEPQQRIGEIKLVNRALGTSGSGTQFFLHDGRRYGHILDPRTGWPAEGTLSTTVAAPTGAEADALATAFYVMGRDAAMHYCRSHPEISAVVMSPVANERTVEIVVCGFAEDEICLKGDESLSVRYFR